LSVAICVLYVGEVMDTLDIHTTYQNAYTLEYQSCIVRRHSNIAV